MTFDCARAKDHGLMRFNKEMNVELSLDGTIYKCVPDDTDPSREIVLDGDDKAVATFRMVSGEFLFTEIEA